MLTPDVEKTLTKEQFNTVEKGLRAYLRLTGYSEMAAEFEAMCQVILARNSQKRTGVPSWYSTTVPIVETILKGEIYESPITPQ